MSCAAIAYPGNASAVRQGCLWQKPLYLAHSAREVEQPFSLLQTDETLQDPEGKDILDKGALGTQRTTQHPMSASPGVASLSMDRL